MSQERSAGGDGRPAAAAEDVVPYDGQPGRRSRSAGDRSGSTGTTAAGAAGAGASAGSSAIGSTATGSTATGSTATEAPTEELSTLGARRGRDQPGPSRAARLDPRAATAAARTSGARRRARLGLVRLDPWSVFVLSLLVSIFLGVVLVVAVVALYSVLQALGVLDSLDTFARDLQVIKDGQTLVTFGRVLVVGAVVAAVDVVLLTVLATLAAFLYNICASVTGGIEVVLTERE